MDVWVLLKAGAVLHAGPDVVVAPELAPIPMLLVSRDADKVVVTTPPRARACYAMSYSGDVAVQLWVAPDDIQAVLSQPEVQLYPDGSSVRLDPGLAVDGGHVRVDGHSFPVQSVGWSYTPDMHRLSHGADIPTLWAPTTARLGDLELPLDPGAKEPWHQPFLRMVVVGEQALLTQELTCARLVWSAPWPPVPADDWPFSQPPGGGGVVGGVLGGVIGPRPDVAARVPMGTPVYWSDGSLAGQTRADVPLGREAVDAESLCWAVGPRGAALNVCAKWEEAQLLPAMGASPGL